jgi:hypothetical protein
MSFPYANFDPGGETDILNVTGIDNNILVKDGNGAITSTFLTNNELQGSIDFAEHINIVGLGTTAGYTTSFQIEDDSVRIGKNPSVSTGIGNISIGDDAQATGNYAVALGFQTRANIASATALGKSCVASGTISVAIGTSCTASGSLSSAVGNTSTASGANSFALGTGATATGTRSLSIGNSTNESGTTDSIAIGSLSTNLTNITTAISIGKSASCKTINGIAIGNTALVNTNSADGIAIGRVSKAQAINAIAIGLGNNTSGVNGLIVGGGNTMNTGAYDGILLGVISNINADCFRSIVIGYNSLSAAINSICIGENARTNNSGIRGIGIGKNSVVNAEDTIAIGTGASSIAANAIAIGDNSIASGIESIAIGLDTNVTTSRGTVCIGKGATIANFSNYSMAIGQQADCTGSGCIAFGYAAISNSENGLAIGGSATATGNNTLAMGGSSSASQQFASALGYGAQADGQFSIAIGQGDVGIAGTRSIAIGAGADVDHADTIVISTNASITTSTRSGLFIDPVSDKTPDSNHSNVHYDTSTKEMYRSPHQLGLVLTLDITTDTTLSVNDLVGKVIRITASSGITVTLPQCFEGANCIIINDTNHNHTLAKLSGNTLNYNATTVSLQTSKRVHHVYGVLRSDGFITSRDWYVD